MSENKINLNDLEKALEDISNIESSLNKNFEAIKNFQISGSKKFLGVEADQHILLEYLSHYKKDVKEYLDFLKENYFSRRR